LRAVSALVQSLQRAADWTPDFSPLESAADIVVISRIEGTQMRIRLLLAGLLAVPVLMAADAPTPPQGWKEYSPKDGSFSVWLPEKSGRRSERERTATVRGVRIKVNLVQVEVRGGPTYEASTLLLPARLVRAVSQKEKIEIIRDIFLNETRGKVSAETDVKQGGVTGKEYTIQMGKGMARLRAFARAGRLYRASVLGGKAQVASTNADTFLDSYKLSGKVAEKQADKGKDKAGTSGKADKSGLKWMAEAGKMEIPDAAVAGKLLGGEFKVDNAKLEPNLGMLTLEKGNADAEIKIFLGIKRDEKLDDKSYKFSAKGASGERRPHIHVARKDAAGGGPTLKAFVDGYAMLLEFGKEKDGKVPGKIYLCLPDDDKSAIAGTFTLKRE
jgi:hypothetical protein